MADVEIVRDTDGIAHVRAPDLAGAFMGQGHAAAEDRFDQMDFDRRKALGRLAEGAGPAAVASDAFHRRADLAGAARRHLDTLGDDAREALRAYADGVNSWLDRSAVGEQAEPWAPWHSIAVFLVRHLLMGTFETKVWRTGIVATVGPGRAERLWPPLPEPTIVPSPEAVRMARDLAADVASFADVLAGLARGGAASNSLALSPARTTTGAPLLAGDPHRALDVPNVYWQNHICCPATDTIGLSFPGVPGFPHFGHSASVAWCITHAMADDQDVYLERLRRTGAGVEVETVAGWVPAPSRTETIEVAGGEPVELTVVETGHGPVVAGGPEDGIGLALRWTALVAPGTTFDALVPMLTARDIAAFDEAMEPWVVPCNNLLTADLSGSIAYRLRGRLAERPAANGWTVVPGWTGAHEWAGFVAWDDHHHVIDPPGGVLVTANQRPAAEGPYVSNDFAHPARATRLHQLLEARQRWAPEELADLLGDTRSLVAPAYVAGLVGVPTRHPLERAAQDVLREWDHRMDVDSPGAAVYAACRLELLRAVAATLGLDRDLVGTTAAGPSLVQTVRLLWSRSAAFPDGLTDLDLAGIGGWSGAWATALRWGVRSLEARLGPRPSAWRWGDLHRARFVDPRGGAVPDAVEVGGDAECVRASGPAPPDLGAVAASVARYVFDLSDWDNSRWIVPHGVAGRPESPHFADQLADWASPEVRLRPMRYSREAIDAATESRTTLTP